MVVISKLVEEAYLAVEACWEEVAYVLTFKDIHNPLGTIARNMAIANNSCTMEKHVGSPIKMLQFTQRTVGLDVELLKLVLVAWQVMVLVKDWRIISFLLLLALLPFFPK